MAISEAGLYVFQVLAGRFRVPAMQYHKYELAKAVNRWKVKFCPCLSCRATSVVTKTYVLKVDRVFIQKCLTPLLELPRSEDALLISMNTGENFPCFFSLRVGPRATCSRSVTESKKLLRVSASNHPCLPLVVVCLDVTEGLRVSEYCYPCDDRQPEPLSKASLSAGSTQYQQKTQ